MTASAQLGPPRDRYARLLRQVCPPRDRYARLETDRPVSRQTCPPRDRQAGLGLPVRTDSRTSPPRAEESGVCSGRRKVIYVDMNDSDTKGTTTSSVSAHACLRRCNCGPTSHQTYHAHKNAHPLKTTTGPQIGVLYGPRGERFLMS